MRRKTTFGAEEIGCWVDPTETDPFGKMAWILAGKCGTPTETMDAIAANNGGRFSDMFKQTFDWLLELAPSHFGLWERLSDDDTVKWPDVVDHELLRVATAYLQGVTADGYIWVWEFGLGTDACLILKKNEAGRNVRALEPRKDWSEVDRIVRRIDRQQAAESDPKTYHSHGPQYGKLEPGCPRCDELRHGAPARVGRGWRD